MYHDMVRKMQPFQLILLFFNNSLLRIINLGQKKFVLTDNMIQSTHSFDTNVCDYLSSLPFIATNNEQSFTVAGKAS